MATNQNLKNQLQNKGNNTPGAKPNELGLKALIGSPTVQEKFREVLKEKSQGFTASV